MADKIILIFSFNSIFSVRNCKNLIYLVVALKEYLLKPAPSNQHPEPRLPPITNRLYSYRYY